MQKLKWMIITLALFVFLSGCNSPRTTPTTTPQETRTVTDALGREVVVPAQVDRIVALSNVPRMAVYLGIADRVVGYSGSKVATVTPLTAYAYAMRALWADVAIAGTDAGGNTDYYPEEIIAVQPDVIFCAYTEDIVTNLQTQTGIPVVVVATGNLFAEDYNQSLRILGTACGVEERAEQVIAYIDTCLADLHTRTAALDAGERPTALSAAATFKGAHGIEGVRIQDQVFAAVHAINVAAQSTADDNTTAIEVDKEQILAWDADYIFCDYGGVELVKQDVAANPDFYAHLTAFNNGRIYQYPSSTSYYANLEISLANSYYVGSVLYPQAFADVDVRAKANEICHFFLGVEDYLSVLADHGASYGPIDFEADR